MKILILRLSSLGDIVLTEPILKILRDKFPESRIDYLTKEVFAPIFDNFRTRPDGIIYWKNKKKLLKELRREKYDLVIDLHKKLNTFLIKKSINPKKTISYNKEHFLRRLIIRKLTKKSIDSTLNLYETALKKLKIEKKAAAPVLLPLNEKEAEIDLLLKKYYISDDKILIGIFPGATHKTKQYPTKHFAKLIKRTPKHWNCHYVLMGTYKEKEICRKIIRKTRDNVTDISGSVSIGELPALINKMNILITNDSGPMHIAAALNKPQIALFGATNTRLGFRPLNQKAIVVEKNPPCQPCSLHGGKECPKQHFICMNSINPLQLLNYLKILINDHVVVNNLA